MQDGLMVSPSEGSMMIPVYNNKAFVNEGCILIAAINLQKVILYSDADLQSISWKSAHF